MRIPLDLYQILGVPIQATPEQIDQAFADRCQQLPRQEYSKAAVEARTQLLQDAHAVLSETKTRTAYDQSLLADSTSIDTQGIELQDNQLIGALLLLQEQSDYERIAQLGSAYLQQSIDLNRLPNTNNRTEEDIVLAMALANLEAGRECWQQKQFEKASDVLQSGLKLLTQEKVFPAVQREIEQDLYKLRPYRILELLAAPETDVVTRQQGFVLLQAMLSERGGIDGSLDDRSGLSVDDFLRFLQQLRCHLTVQEQQDLFEQEAKHSSAVARYLLAYTLVARGYSQGQPVHIQQAKATFTKLADRQDIYVEKSMCYLLLGQPGSAIQALPRSRDQESLEFIHQYSEGSDDLVPGLFLYTERWLQQEVYPYFRDLADTQVSLQHYFNDERIQAHLTALVPDSVAQGTAPVAQDLPLLAKQGRETLNSAKEGSLPAQKAHRQPIPNIPHRTPKQETPRVMPLPTGGGKDNRVQRPAAKVQDSSPITSSTRSGMGSAVMDKKQAAPGVVRDITQEKEQQRSQLRYRRWFWAAGAVALALLALLGLISQCSRPEDPTLEVDPLASDPGGSIESNSTAPRTTQSPRLAPSPANQSPNATPPVAPQSSPNSSTASSPRPNASGTTQPPSPNPSATTQSPNPTLTPTVAKGEVTTTSARQIIQSWQSAKSEAMGKDYQTGSLDKILVDPILSEWKAGAQSYQANQTHLEYTFEDLKINAIKQKSPTQTTVEATVTESAKEIAGEQSANEAYSSDTYRVRYELIREQDEWKIKQMQVFE